MPLYEIEERFTKSDLVVLGWRSQETAYLMDKKMKRGSAAAGPPSEFQQPAGTSLPMNLPERFFDPESGELDLRRVTGLEALKFLRMQGINVPFVPFSAHKESKERS